MFAKTWYCSCRGNSPVASVTDGNVTHVTIWPAKPLIKRWKQRVRRKDYETMSLLVQEQQLVWLWVPHRPALHCSSPGTLLEDQPWEAIVWCYRSHCVQGLCTHIQNYRCNRDWQQGQKILALNKSKTFLFAKYWWTINTEAPGSHSQMLSRGPLFFWKEETPTLRKVWIGSKMELHWQDDSPHLWPPISVFLWIIIINY